MFNESRSEQDVWTRCIKVILSLLEDSLFNETISKVNVKEFLKANESTDTLSLPESPSNYSIKRKRSFTDTLQDRKIQKISNNLANDIARSLKMDDPPTSYRSNHQDNPVPLLRRISTTEESLTTLNDWLKFQSQKSNVPLTEYRSLFNDKQKQLRYDLDLLQKSNQSFEAIRDHLSRVLKLANELSGDHTLSFIKIFPEWSLYEAKISKIANYVQSIEDMNYTISTTIPQSNNLLSDIQNLQSILDMKSKLYGDNLVQNGLEWKAMGLPVNEALLNSAKHWIAGLCIDLLHALDRECKKIENYVQDMKELVQTEVGENLMGSILNGIEFISDGTSLIGYSSDQVIWDCYVLVTIYSKWVIENLENLNEAKRIDIKFMQLFDNMTRLLNYLNTISDLFEMKQHSNVLLVENLASSLVELVIRAIQIIQIHRKSTSQKVGNIMLNPQTSFIYMAESLLTFTSKLIELADREYPDGKRLKTLQNYLEDLENSLVKQ